MKGGNWHFPLSKPKLLLLMKTNFYFDLSNFKLCANFKIINLLQLLHPFNGQRFKIVQFIFNFNVFWLNVDFILAILAAF
jgi:hypothetical protein